MTGLNHISPDSSLTTDIAIAYSLFALLERKLEKKNLSDKFLKKKTIREHNPKALTMALVHLWTGHVDNKNMYPLRRGAWLPQAR